LCKSIKLRALRDGKKLKDTVTDLLKAGLGSSSSMKPRGAGRPVFVKDRKTGLLVIRCPRRPSPEEVSPERVTQMLIDQEAEWARESA
jgi:hypothetical protein